MTSEYSELLRISAPHFREMWQKHRQYMGALITDSELQLLTSGNVAPVNTLHSDVAGTSNSVFNTMGITGGNSGIGTSGLAVGSDANSMNMMGFNNDMNTLGFLNSEQLGLNDHNRNATGNNTFHGIGSQQNTSQSLASGQFGSMPRDFKALAGHNNRPYLLQDHSSEASVNETRF